MWTLLYRDLWCPIWPNLAASGICLPIAFVWHHRKIKAHVTKAMEAVRSSDRDA